MKCLKTKVQYLNQKRFLIMQKFEGIIFTRNYYVAYSGEIYLPLGELQDETGHKMELQNHNYGSWMSCKIFILDT